MTHSRPRITWMLFWLLLFPLTVPVTAQDDDCPVDVQLALQQSREFCVDLGYDQVCYGNRLVTAVPQPQIERLSFEAPGDMENVLNVRSLSLSAMDPVSNVWGIAHMHLLVNTSALQPGDIYLVLFGDVQVDNQAEDRPALTVTVSVEDYINVREYPYLRAGEVATLAPGDTATAVGRLASNTWLRVEVGEARIAGWVQASLVTPDGELDTLRVEENAFAPLYRPMQAFFYSSGGNTGCSSVPADGLLVQTPEGQARVTFLINEVSIDLYSGQSGGTAFIQAQPAGDMSVTVLEGAATVKAGYISYTAVAGSQISIPLNDDLSPAGPPGLPVPFDSSLVEGIASLDVGLDITAPPPATWDMIAQANGLVTEGAAEDGEEELTLTATETTPEEEEGRPDCPGQSCEAPGHNK